MPSHCREFAGLDMSDEPLNPEWRERIRLVGKRNFENEEMLRLGFIDEETVARIGKADLNFESYRKALFELVEIQKQLKGVKEEIAALHDIEELIADIRARRIARVKAERAERKERKAAEEAEHRAQVAERKRIHPTFLGRGVSKWLTFSGGDAKYLEQKGLPVYEEFAALAAALKLEPEQLQWLCYARATADSDHYRRFTIPKRSGGARVISSPKGKMAQAQQWILANVLRNLPVHPAATAFRPGLSIKDNALPHSNKGVVVRMDIKDFFPSLTFTDVRKYFADLGYNPGIATIFALLTTDEPRIEAMLDGKKHFVAVGERSLPQGACTSPALANLLVWKLDTRLAALARSLGWHYTRYADDLVFSADSFDEDAPRLINIVWKIVSDEGFKINEKKTRVMRAPQRQTVTGLLVNSGPKLTRQDMRRIRAFLHRCEVRGVAEVSKEIGKSAASVADGYLAYIHMIDPKTAAALRAKHPWI